MKDGRWHQTHFVFHSLDPALLPVVDIFNLSKTTPGSHYHLEVGPVCFLWEFQWRASDHGGKDHHPGASVGVEIKAFSHKSVQKREKKNPSECKPPSEKQPPIGLQTQREEEQGAGTQMSWGGAEEFLH